MAELFRSAFSYFSSTTSAQPPPIGKADHPLVGTTTELGELRVKIRSLIAEGGYALVFSAQDQQGNWYALKRQLASDREAAAAILREIKILKQLDGHQAILRFVRAGCQSAQESGHGRSEFLLLTELCPGSVIGLLQSGALTVSQVLKIFYATCTAIQHMHSCDPPIIHRDIKVENLLFDANGFVKLCDFGSATTSVYTPDESWNAHQRLELEEELSRYTTPMYRAPEIVDMYSNYPIDTAQDIWALGCLLYYLCFRKHPFEDSAKLRIINARYLIPEGDTVYHMFHPLIQNALKVDPRMRPTIGDYCECVKALAVALSISPGGPIDGLMLPQLPSTPSPSLGRGQNEVNSVRSSSAQPPKASPIVQRKSEHETTAQQASAMLGALKGQGMSWLKNIKDKTNAMAQTVQQTYGARGPDVTQITSRLVVAPLVESIPETLAVQAEESMRLYVSEHARGKFATYNLATRHLRCDYSGRVSEVTMPPVSSGLTPTVKCLLNLCKNMVFFLKQQTASFVLVTGPESQCVLVAAALILYTRLVPRPLTALELISMKRQAPTLPPSYHRQLDLIAKIVSSTPSGIRDMTHNRLVSLSSLEFSPVPLFNRARTGCRPFVEIHAGGTKLWSTYKYFGELKLFEAPESDKVEIPLGDVPVSDDVQIVVFHARWSKMQNRVQHVLMFSINFHANFTNCHNRVLELNRGDLDRMPDDESKFGEPLRVAVSLKFGDRDRGFNRAEPPVFLTYERGSVPRGILLADQSEYDTITQQLGLPQRSRCHRPPRPPETVRRRDEQTIRPTTIDERQKLVDVTKPVPANSFFATLQWQDPNDQHLEVERIRNADDDLYTDVEDIRGNRAEAPKATEVTHTPAAKLMHRVSNVDTAEACERMAGIRVTTTEEEPVDAQYKFDYEKKTEPKQMADTNITTVTVECDEKESSVDLLGLEKDINVVSCSPSNQDLPNGYLLDGINSHITDLSALHNSASAAAVMGEDGVDDLLGDYGMLQHESSSDGHGIQRNVSAPSFPGATNMPSTSMPKFDPFAEFLAATQDVSATSSGHTSTNNQKPNYSRAHFDALNSIQGQKSKDLENAFDDLLTSQGFSSSAKNVKSLGEMKREEDIRDLDPVTIKVRDWTKGKEKNIRALLVSLNDVLWEGADNWVQPKMGDLLTAPQVKKCYRRACLVVHPDKQVGKENEALARAIFTELNDAWTAFENSGFSAS